MRTITITSSILALAFLASPALADDHHYDHNRDRTHDQYRGHGDRDQYRGHGDRDRGQYHQAPRPAYTRNPGYRGHIRFDPRPSYVIRNDPRFHVTVRGYHPRHSWGRYHMSRGRWLNTWGIASWNSVSTVTCEAVNQDTGQMYPVSMDRDQIGWSGNAINSVLDQALDDCYADGGGAACLPAQPACTQQ
jgi:hypothetical protein